MTSCAPAPSRSNFDADIIYKDNKRYIRIGDELFEMITTLGEGAFGQVHLILSEARAGAPFAMKRIIRQNENEQMIANIKKECLLQRKVTKEAKHMENIIRFLGTRSDSKAHMIFLEYADGGELFDKIDPDVGMSAACAQFFFRQLMRGLQAIHDVGVVHRDIKPENLLLTTNNVLKISDFGMATVYMGPEGERELSLSCGTIPYAAPEVVSGKKYRGPPIDVWSAAVVLVAMLTGELPWDKASDASMAYLCWLDNSNLEENPWKKIDVRGLCLLRKMLTDNVAKRATIEQVMLDPWYVHNYGKLETASGRPLKRRRREPENEENEPIGSTQVAESALTAKRAHLEVPSVKNSTPNEKCTVERTSASFSQPTYTDDLLLTQHIDMSQNNQNLLQRMVRRMTRFCVNVDVIPAYQKVACASEHAGFSVRRVDSTQLLVTYREVSMMVTLYTMGDGVERARVMVDFRRSRGDGIQFKKMFMEVRNRMHDFICLDGCDWLADCGFMSQTPKFVSQKMAETASAKDF